MKGIECIGLENNKYYRFFKDDGYTTFMVDKDANIFIFFNNGAAFQSFLVIAYESGVCYDAYGLKAIPRELKLMPSDSEITILDEFELTALQ